MRAAYGPRAADVNRGVSLDTPLGNTELPENIQAQRKLL